MNYGKINSPLSIAIVKSGSSNHEAMVRYLLENNALITHQQVRTVVERGFKNILKILCEFGAGYISDASLGADQPENASKLDYLEQALGIAVDNCDAEMVEILVRDLKVDVSSCPIGTTKSPLTRIAEKWCPKKVEDLSQAQLLILKILEEYGANPSDLNLPKDIRRYRQDFLDKIEKGMATGNAFADNLPKNISLATAIIHDNKVIFELFLNFSQLNLEKRFGNEMCSLLMMAAAHSKDASFYVKKILEKRSNVHTRDKNNNTSLHYVSLLAATLHYSSRTEFPDHIETIKALIHAGINMHVRNNSGQTALMQASSCFAETITEFLYQEWQLLFKEDFDDSKELDAYCHYVARIFANAIKETKGAYELVQFKGLCFHTVKLPFAAFKEQSHFDEILGRYQEGCTEPDASDFYKILVKIFKEKVFQRKFKELSLTSNDILEYLWQQSPMKKAFDKRQKLKERQEKNDEIGVYEQSLTWLPKKMYELPHRMILAEINEIINKIDEIIGKIDALSKDDFVNPRFNKKQERRCKTIRKIRYGHDGSDGELAVKGVVSLSTDAISQYKKIQKTVKDFFLSYSGNPSFMFKESTPAEYNASINTLMYLKPELHNKTSHFYISFLLRNGSVELGKELLGPLEKLKNQAEKECEEFRNTLENLNQHLNICQRLHEEAIGDNCQKNTKCKSNRKVSAANSASAADKNDSGDKKRSC